MLRQHLTNKAFLFVCFLVFFFVYSTSVSPAEETKKANGEATKKIEGPIVITSQMLTADNKARTALFERSVVARTPDITLYADKMLVYYEKDSGNVTRIEAEGQVKVIKEQRIITSKAATYYADSEQVIFTGEPRAMEGENVVTGTKMVYLMKEDRFLVEDSKVILTKKEKN
jgi:lipopolysaccharide export system protein LptA